MRNAAFPEQRENKPANRDSDYCSPNNIRWIMHAGDNPADVHQDAGDEKGCPPLFIIEINRG